MKGAIIGDIVGSVYEFNNIATKDFPFFSSACTFTDDTVMTCAVARALMSPERDTAEVLQYTGLMYPHAGYGNRFIHWLSSENPQPNNSCGNGAAMRVSPVGFFAKTEEEVKALSRKVTEVSHNHIAALAAAECTAMCIFRARQGATMDELHHLAESYYHMNKTVDEYRAQFNGHHGKETCPVSMPPALQCFFESKSFEDCIRNCVSIGGDTDTVAAIAGGIAEAYYGVPEDLWEKAKTYLPEYLLEIVDRFYSLL